MSDSILELARQVNPKVEQQHIVELSGGYSSKAYKINIADSPFVLLIEREGAVSSANYGHSYTVLSLLQKHNLAHAPLPLWLEPNHKALAVSFFEGIAADQFDFAASAIDTEQLSIAVIDNLLDAAVVELNEYKELASRLNVTPLPIQTAQDAAREYGQEWFKIVQKSCPDPSIINWLEPRIETMQRLANTMNRSKPALGHNDPSNPNILLNTKGDFMLIDWDSARFHTAGPEFYISYTTELTDFMKPYSQKLIEHVASKLDMAQDEFANRVHECRRFSSIGDVNWAAMMMAKVNSGEIEGNLENFRNLARQRIARYEQAFEH